MGSKGGYNVVTQENFTSARSFAKSLVRAVEYDYRSRKDFGAAEGYSLRDYWHYCNDFLQEIVLKRIMRTLKPLPCDQMGALLGELAFCARGGRYNFGYKADNPIPVNTHHVTVNTGGILKSTLTIARKVHDDWDGPSKLVLLAMKAVLSELYELVDESIPHPLPIQPSEEALELSVP